MKGIARLSLSPNQKIKAGINCLVLSLLLRSRASNSLSYSDTAHADQEIQKYTTHHYCILCINSGPCKGTTTCDARVAQHLQWWSMQGYATSTVVHTAGEVQHLHYRVVDAGTV